MMILPTNNENNKKAMGQPFTMFILPFSKTCTSGTVEKLVCELYPLVDKFIVSRIVTCWSFITKSKIHSNEV